MVNKVLKKDSLRDAVFPIKNKIVRMLWAFIYLFFFKYSPRPMFAYRAFMLRLFGAKIGNGTAIYSSVKVWLPSNLKIGDRVAVGEFVNLYNQGKITIGDRAIISQGAHLCASTHDYNDVFHSLLLAPIEIEHDAWICADAFVGPYVCIGAGAVLGARSVASKSINSWTVNAGNPAIKIKDRKEFCNE
jgi:putative colanic acid biosynthesis acetyltransferase WcaF